MPGRGAMSTPAVPWPADWLVPDWPAPPWVRAVCTTRSGGVSGMPWGSLNLGDHVGDDPAAVQANRDRLAACLQAAPSMAPAGIHLGLLSRSDACPQHTYAPGVTFSLGDSARRRFAPDVDGRKRIVALQLGRALCPPARGESGKRDHFAYVVAHVKLFYIPRQHPVRGVRLNIDLFDPAGLDEVVDIGAAQGR